MPPSDDEKPVNFKTVLYRGGVKPKKGLSKTAKWGIGAALTLGASVLGLNTYLNRPYTESVCKTTPLTSMMWQGGNDAKRAETIQNIEQYLSTTDNRDDQILGEAALQILRADAQDVDFDSINPEIVDTSVIQYLSFINDMRGDRFDAALETITNAIDNRALDCAETGAWDTNNRRNTIIRHAFNNSHFDSAYKIASHIFSNNPTTQYQLNFMAGYIQTYKDSPNPEIALNHFTAARDHADDNTETQQSEFYIGTSYNALDLVDDARTHFSNATRINQTSFYGQLSAFYNGTSLQYETPTLRLNPNDPPLAFAINNENCADRTMIDQRANTPAIPASLTKIMALYTFAQIMARNDVDLNPDTKVRIPEIIRDKIPHDLAVIDSLTVGREVSVRDLLVMTGARSDAVSTVALAIAAGRAEGWEGSEENVYDRFVALMNKNADDLNMTKTQYGNPIGNSTGRGDSGNISSPNDTNILMNAFERNFPNVFELALGHGHIDIRPYSAARTSSSRTLQDNPNVIASKTGILRDRDPHYNLTAGYNQVDHVNIRDITSMRSHFTISVFGSDSTDNREDIMVDLTGHLSNIDTRAFCIAPADFNYHPDLPFYTARPM